MLTSTVLFAGTPVAPAAGEAAVQIGGVTSLLGFAPVVNDHDVFSVLAGEAPSDTATLTVTVALAGSAGAVTSTA
jgi:hypothetical protein